MVVSLSGCRNLEFKGMPASPKEGPARKLQAACDRCAGCVGFSYQARQSLGALSLAELVWAGAGLVGLRNPLLHEEQPHG